MGAVSPQRRRAIHRALIQPFERRSRVITPSYGQWRRSGEVIGQLVHKRRLSAGGFARSFVNDVLLAVSCRDAGATLITTNERDFALIKTVERFTFAAPWP